MAEHIRTELVLDALGHGDRAPAFRRCADDPPFRRRLANNNVVGMRAAAMKLLDYSDR